ncbi:MAG: HAD hydrolase-like protein [Micromonosporaceae bacterium]|nr:HAD hydrolase-like protein [Micromonosporaceae bacterium]
MRSLFDAVVLDLFGTLVAAPTAADRHAAADRISRVLHCGVDQVDRYLGTSWQKRHDGTLGGLLELAEDLVRCCRGTALTAGLVADTLSEIARCRLRPHDSVVRVLERLRHGGVRIGVLSDASAEIAAAWPSSPLADHVDAAVFSCAAGCVKPDPRLYARIADLLGVPPARTLYCGDGGGDELGGAQRAGMTAVGVRRRGPADALVYGPGEWLGATIHTIEDLDVYLRDVP